MENNNERARSNQQNQFSSSERNADSKVEKNPDDWVTGDEPMTGPQRSYLNTLAREAGEPPVPDMTKAEASKKIEELQQRTGRGTEENN